MPWFVWFITLALLLYSWAVWGAHRERELCPFFVLLFALGFACDLIGTSLMAALVPGFCLKPHALLGVSSLVIMALHGVWAYLALDRPSFASLFHRWSLWAYALWMLAFITSGALRLLGR